MIILMTAIISKSAYTAIKIKMRYLRLNKVNAAAVLASYGYLVPVYLAMAVLLYCLTPQLLSLKYAIFVVITACLNWVSCFVPLWLYARFPPGRLELFHKAAIVVIAAIWDVLVMHWIPSVTHIMILGVAFCAALILQFLQQNSDNQQTPSFKTTLYILPIMLVVAVITSLQWGTFQLGIKLLGGGYESSFFHMGIHGTVTLGLFWIIGRRFLYRDQRTGKFPVKDQVTMISLLFIAATAEALVLGAVPLTVFSLISLSGVGVLWCHDVWAKHEKFNFIKFLLVVVIFTSLIWLIYHT